MSSCDEEGILGRTLRIRVPMWDPKWPIHIYEGRTVPWISEVIKYFATFPAEWMPHEVVSLVRPRQGMVTARSNSRPEVKLGGFLSRRYATTELIQMLAGAHARNLPPDSIFRNQCVEFEITPYKWHASQVHDNKYQTGTVSFSEGVSLALNSVTIHLS